MFSNSNFKNTPYIIFYILRDYLNEDQYKLIDNECVALNLFEFQYKKLHDNIKEDVQEFMKKLNYFTCALFIK